MTQKEHTDAVLAAYRQGYRDGVEDRPSAPATNGLYSPAPDNTPNPESMEMYNQLLNNFLGYDGKAQETPESIVRRTRA
jgi:hypothetical protein